jgi:hypothetical protein
VDHLLQVSALIGHAPPQIESGSYVTSEKERFWTAAISLRIAETMF